LLEKITALNSTIGSFQELSDSASTLLNDFESETAGLDQEIRKQINELKGFEPQIRKADALDERMKKGRQRVEELGKRLEAVRQQIDSWEEREAEWQTRTSRRLRIFWGIVSGAFVVLVLALVLQNWPTIGSPHADAVPVPTELTKLVNETSPGSTHLPDTWESVMRVSDLENGSGSSWYPASLAERRQSLEHAQAAPTASASSRAEEKDDAATRHDPFRLLDEL
jgi:tetrahydromethanopterin S-methyltransferase subunit B